MAMAAPLGAIDKKRRDWRWCTLVRVWNPGVKWDRADLKA